MTVQYLFDLQCAADCVQFKEYVKNIQIHYNYNRHVETISHNSKRKQQQQQQRTHSLTKHPSIKRIQEQQKESDEKEFNGQTQQTDKTVLNECGDWNPNFDVVNPFTQMILSSATSQ